MTTSGTLFENLFLRKVKPLLGKEYLFMLKI